MWYGASELVPLGEGPKYVHGSPIMGILHKKLTLSKALVYQHRTGPGSRG